MWGNTPVWDGIKRQSGCYVTFYEKYINFEKRLASSWLTRGVAKGEATGAKASP